VKPVFPAPRAMLERKPRHGAACNHCGLCCTATLCDLAQHVFKRPAYPGPCPALGWSSAKQGPDVPSKAPRAGCAKQGPAPESVCGLVAWAEREGRDALRTAALHLIGSDDGCDARFNGEPRDMEYAARQSQHWNAPDTVAKTRAAARAWGMK
jgi:hypothetical protein